MIEQDRIGMTDERPAWRVRPAILAAIGLTAAIIVQQVLHETSGPIAPGRVAIATFIGTGALAFGFGLERRRWAWAALFAGVMAIVAGLIIWWNGSGDSWPYIWGWPNFSLFLAIAIAAPLFQTARDEGGWRFPYRIVHGHAWTNVVLWFACWAFVGIAFLLAWLLAALFDLIGIDLLSRLLGKSWIDAALMGASFGGALGLLRERHRIVGLLQRVVTAVLGVLAPVLGLGLALFLLALPFTGLDALWGATRSTTPILLTCIIGALILANAVIADTPDDESDNAVLRWGAMALALVILPLAVIAAIATGLRIDQYGFTPDRLWGLIFVVIACGYGVAYLAALVRGRMAWGDRVRPANLRLAFALAGIALLLATPILGFNAISTRDQVARLESGRIAPDQVDWTALAFDFGDPGKRAVKRLAHSKNPEIARLAGKAASAKDRWSLSSEQTNIQNASNLDQRLRVLPRPAPIPTALRERLTQYDACSANKDEHCTVFWRPGSREAVAIGGDCRPDKPVGKDSRRKANPTIFGNRCSVAHLVFDGKAWDTEFGLSQPARNDAQQDGVAAGLKRGQIEIRPVERRQVFIGGVPVGDTFE